MISDEQELRAGIIHGALLQAIAEAVRKEREACAKIVDEIRMEGRAHSKEDALEEAAGAIRLRGNP